MSMYILYKHIHIYLFHLYTFLVYVCTYIVHREIINIIYVLCLQNGSYPIHLAALQGNSDMVRVLASRGADLNPTDNEGK